MRRAYTSLAVGLVLAIIAVVMLYSYIQTLGGPVAAPANSLSVANIVVAKKDLPFGTKLAPELLGATAWPKDSIPQGAFTSVDALLAGADGGNRIVLTMIASGEPVLQSKVSGFGARPTMSRQVADGMRALAVRIDDVIGVAGFVLPGDRVDILLTHEDQGGVVTDILLQNITILGIDQLTDQASEKPVVARTATVEVTPEQAQKLALAQRSGSLSLALRNVDTSDQVEARQVGTNDLSNHRRIATVAGNPATTVRVRYGDGAPVTRTVQP